MSDLLQQQQLPQSQLDNETKQNEEEQNAMWDSVALAALTEEDNDDDQTTRNRAKDSEHDENDQGDNGNVLATSSDIGSVQLNSNGIQDMNNSSNSGKSDAFGECLCNRIFSNTCHCLRIFLARLKLFFAVQFHLLCAIKFG